MSNRLPDDPLDLLRSMPAPGASPGFTARVLSRLDTRGRERARRRGAALLAAAATLGAAVGFSVLEYRVSRREARAEQIRSRYRDLVREVADLRGKAAEAPLLYLGGDDRFDLVLDLRPLAETMAAGNPRPAAYPPVETHP